MPNIASRIGIEKNVSDVSRMAKAAEIKIKKNKGKMSLKLILKFLIKIITLIQPKLCMMMMMVTTMILMGILIKYLLLVKRKVILNDFGDNDA